MKKPIVFPIMICFLAAYCTPPPKRPVKKDQLQVENLIYSVALSSLRMAHQMDVRRKNAVLKQMQLQLKRERAQSAVARAALREYLEDQINSRPLTSAEGDNRSGDGFQVYNPKPQKPVEFSGGELNNSELASELARSFEERLTQLETLVFGGEDVNGILSQVKILKGDLSDRAETTVSTDISGSEDSSDRPKADVTAEIAGNGGLAETPTTGGDGIETSTAQTTTATDTPTIPPAGADSSENPTVAATAAAGSDDASPAQITSNDNTDTPTAQTASNDDSGASTAQAASDDSSGASTDQTTTAPTATAQREEITLAQVTHLIRLENIIYGTKGSPGLLFQLIELKLSSSSVDPRSAEAQDKKEEAGADLEAQDSLTSALDLSFTDRLVRLENALFGDDGDAENEGIISAVADLQSKAAPPQPLSTNRD